MKKLFAMIMAATSLILCGVSACKKPDDNNGAEKPVYESNEKFDIGMWVGVSDNYVTYDENGQKISSRPMTDDEFLAKYQDIADAGINIAFPGYDVMINGRGGYNLKALKAAHEVGIKHVLGDSDLRDYLMSAKTLVSGGLKTEEEIVSHVKDLLKMYTDSEYYDALYGFMIRDEPSAELFEALGYAEKIFKKAAPGLMFYVNLFPVIAGGAQLGGSSAITYDSYLTRWVSTVKTNYISYDHYPLYGSLEDQTSIESSFLYNMDVMKTKINDEGENRKLWTFLQSIQFGAKNRAVRNKADIAFQAYSFLAYGGDGIQWFCYAAPPENDGATHFGNNSLVTREYEKTETYNYVKSVNEDIQSLMKYYKNFTWKGIKISSVYDDTENFAMLENSENIVTPKNMTKFESEEDSFAGIFEDKNGREGYLVVNFTDPALNRNNKITLTVKNATNAIVVKNGGETVEKIKNDKLELTLSAGDGVFVIPY